MGSIGSRALSACLAVLCLLALAQGAQAAPAKTKPSGPGYWQVSDAAGLLRAASRVTPAGGTIVLRPGTYVIDRTLTFRKTNTLNIVGSGWDVVIRRAGAGNALAFVDCAFCTVRRLMVVGDPSAPKGSGIAFQGQSSSNAVESCRITTFAESGVRFEGDAKAPQSSNTVSNCHFIDNQADQLWSYQNNDFFIVGNQFGAHARVKDLAPRTGAVLHHSSAGTYSRNYHWENRVAMRLGPGAHYNRIENNRFENSREQGVLIGEPAGGDGNWMNIFLGNTIHTNSMGRPGAYAAVEAYDAADTLFCANQVFSWNSGDYKHRSSLVLARGCSHWIVKDNTFRHNTGPALVGTEGATHIVKDNITD